MSRGGGRPFLLARTRHGTVVAVKGRSGLVSAVLFAIAAGLVLIATWVGSTTSPEILGLSLNQLAYLVAGLAFLAGVVALAYRRLPR